MNAPESTLSRLALAAGHGLRTLAPGQALAFCPRQAGVLHIERGAAWVTFDVPPRGRPRGPLGDLYLPAGSGLPVLPGQGLVLEPIAARGHPVVPLVFRWRLRAPAPRRAAEQASGYRQAPCDTATACA